GRRCPPPLTPAEPAWLRSAGDRRGHLVLPAPRLHPGVPPAGAGNVRPARADSGRPLSQADRQLPDEAPADRRLDEEGLSGSARAAEPGACERGQEARAVGGRERSPACAAGALAAVG